MFRGRETVPGLDLKKTVKGCLLNFLEKLLIVLILLKYSK
jgi:hypothetical protein